MSPENVFFLNYGLHSLAFGFLGWLILRCLIRDALRRSVTAMIAILFSVGGPWLISSLPPFNEGSGKPALARLHQTLDTDWRIVIRPEISPAASPEMATPHVAKFVWHADRWMLWLKWVFWSGVCTLLLRHLWQTGRIVMWRRGLREPAQEELALIPQALRDKPLAVFHHPGTPCLVGWFRPLIAVPASSFGTLTARQWHWLVRHEEEHLRGRDTLVSWLHECVRAVLWWNPFVHALIECHARAREEICDAAAVGEAGENKDYAEFLLSWVRTCHPMAGVMPMAQSRPAQRLRGRLKALVEARPVRRRLGMIFVLACTAGAVVGPLLVASVGLVVPSVSAAAEPAIQVGNDIPYQPGDAPVEQKTSPRVAGKNVILSVHVADLPAVSQLTANLGLDEKDKAELDLLLGVLDPPLKGQFSVTGVLTEAQIRLVMRALAQQQGAAIVALPSSVVENGKEAVFHFPENLGGRSFAVTPRVSADGYTIDLMVTPPMLDPAQKEAISSAVTIWSKQTVILGGYLAEANDHSRIIFVTATLLEENGEVTK